MRLIACIEDGRQEWPEILWVRTLPDVRCHFALLILDALKADRLISAGFFCAIIHYSFGLYPYSFSPGWPRRAIDASRKKLAIGI